MMIAGLIGDPVEHSLSPSMHNAAFQALGIAARYDLWQTSLDDLPTRVARLRGPGVLGANVTVPHKQAVKLLVDDVSDTARRIGAVNTLIPRDGRIVGDNTDAYGFSRALSEVAGSRIPRGALVVGAGGASRAVLVSLQDAGVTEIGLVNRTFTKAQALADDLNGEGRTAIVPLEWPGLAHAAASASVVINATSIGWHGDELPFDPGVIESLESDCVVFDLTYRSTALLRLASKHGLRAVDGLPMLIHQGARAFALWTGEPAPVEIMTRAVQDEQARRG